MNRAKVNSWFILFCILFSGCGGNVAIKPVVIERAENYTEDGLRAFSEAHWDNAQRLFSKALTLYQGIDNQSGVLYSHINLAEVALSVYDFSTVEVHLDQAGKLAKKKSLMHLQPRITLLESLSALKQKQTTQAESVLKTILPAFEGENFVEVPNAIQIVAIATRTQVAFLQNQQMVLWTHRFANALIMSATKQPELEARLLRFQSRLLQNQGRYVDAESNLQQALFSYKNHLTRSGIAVTLSELGQLSLIEGRWQDAQDYFLRSIAVYRYLKNTDKIIHLTQMIKKIEHKLETTEKK